MSHREPLSGGEPLRGGEPLSRGEPLGILLVGGSDLHSPDEKQFLTFARYLVGRGHRVLFALRAGSPDYGREQEIDPPAGLALHEYRLVGRRLRRADVDAARRFAPNLIHALYPRGTVLAACAHWSRVTGAPLLAHIADDEWGLASGPRASSTRERFELRARRAAAAAWPWVWPYSTPGWLRYVAEHARSFDALTPALAQEVGRRFGRDCAVLLPAFEFVNQDADSLDPDVTAIFSGRSVALYTGAVGPVHEPDVRLGLRALAEVQRRGHAIDFVHAGPIDDRRHPLRLAAEEGLEPGTAKTLGYVEMATVPGLLRRAAVLLQPGAPSEFNRLRLPSKLQAYLASGSPTVTFAVGFGELLEDRREVLKTYTADPVELADRIVEVLEDAGLRARLAVGGPAAARRLFDPVANTNALEAHYRAALSDYPERRGPSLPRR
jgi:glycosyltransferase involved in cell wall biosynthesis